MTESHHLIIAAHGSRREASNQEVRELTELLRSRLDKGFSDVDSAFLELAQPSIEQAIDTAVVAGAVKITVLPYFLVAGRHVAEDIPRIVAGKREQYPDVEINLRDYFGADSRVADLLAVLAHTAAGEDGL